MESCWDGWVVSFSQAVGVSEEGTSKQTGVRRREAKMLCLSAGDGHGWE